MLRNIFATMSLLGTSCLQGEWKWQWKWLQLDKLKQCPAALSHSANTFASITEAIKKTSFQEVEKHARSLYVFSSEFLACINLDNSSEKLQQWFYTVLKTVKKETLITELNECEALTTLSAKFTELAQCVANFKADDVCEQLILDYEQAERALTNCINESPLMKAALEHAYEQVGLSDLGPMIKTLSFYGFSALFVISAVAYRKEIVNATVHVAQACFSQGSSLLFSNRPDYLNQAERGLLDPSRPRQSYLSREEPLVEDRGEPHHSLRRRKCKAD